MVHGGELELEAAVAIRAQGMPATPRVLAVIDPKDTLGSDRARVAGIGFFVARPARCTPEKLVESDDP
jgi:hypothetical protein